jgi:hypothetical protein
LFALLFNDAEAVCAPLLPFASMRTPTSLKEPDWLFPAGTPGKLISILEFSVLSTGTPTPANTPVAPSILIGSFVGIDGATNPAGEDVIGDGYEILRVVVVNGELAISEPETRIPAPDTPGLAVCALLFVWTSFDEGSGISERLTWANELDAMAKNTSIVSTPTIIFDLNVICSPFKVATKQGTPASYTAPQA